MDKNKKFYSFSDVKDNSADIHIYGDIVSYEWYEQDVSSFGFKKELDALGEVSELNVHINSYGGSTIEGLAIYNLLKQHKAKVNVFIDGIAASAASVIAMAGDRIMMPKTSILMIHNCWTYTMGNSKELRKTADDMDKIATAYKAAYLSKINITEDKLEELLEEESYLTAQECIDMGFADEIIELKDTNQLLQSNMCIYNLVNKIKQKTKEENKTVNLNKETIKKIAEEITEKLIEEKPNNKQAGQNQEQDTLLVSFFNNFLK